MRTLSILSRKGGTGKTTVSIHMAALAAQAGLSTVLSDLDPQGSSLEWARTRAREAIAGGPRVIESKVGTLFTQRLAAAREGTDLMVIDTRPSTDLECAEAIRWADLCLITVRPSYFDLKAIVRTAELVKQLGKPALFVINQAPSQRMGSETRAVLETYEALIANEIPVAPIGLRYRTAYQAAIRKGMVVNEFTPGSNADAEMQSLWALVQARVWPETADRISPGSAPPLALVS
jgi:chromosome partitioning protein